MQLHSLYITDFRNFDAQGFNFTSKFNIEYVFLNNLIQIKIKPNNDYVPNLFDYENLKNITAIIGQNGAGKTNCLDFIKNHMPKGEGDLVGDSIQIVELEEHDEYDGISPKRRIYYPSHWDVELYDLTKSFAMFGVRVDKSRAMVSWDKIDVYGNTTFVFYSNVFDGREENEKDGLKNISTNYLLRKDYNRYENNMSQVDAYNESELLRQLLFVVSDHPNKSLPFDLPMVLEVSILPDDFIAIKEYLGDLGLDHLRDLADTSFVFRRIEGYEDLFLTELYIAAFFNFIRPDIQFNKRPLLYDLIKKINTENIKASIVDFLHAIAYDSARPFSDLARGTLKFLRLCDFMIYNGILFVGGQLPSHSLRIKQYREEVEVFINIYNQTKGFSNFLKFEWSDLSSGQKSLLTFFARFYSLVDELNPSSDRLEKNVVILIDEGDTYFHPEWQRKYLNILVDFFGNTFSQKSVQIILTSNSPFIASDLPKSNIIFIDKNGKVLPTINSREETFASNIHTLFADSFFMEEALIGDFSKKKIDEIIEYLHSNEFSIERTNKYRMIIKMIGEPVIRYKIEEMWIEKLGREEEIEILRRRLNELEKGEGI